MRMLRSLVWVALLVVPAHADTLLLGDGPVVVGPRAEETPDGVTLHFEHGALRIPASRVLARYDAGSPEERIQADAARRHRVWRNRYVEDAPPFRFETTTSRPVFHLHRDHLLAYHAALRAELGVETPDGPPLPVCLHKDARDFQQIGGVSGGTVVYYRHVPPREIVSYDDPTSRATCLRALQWATASHVIGLAFPALSHRHPLHGALVDFYGAAEPQDDDPAAFRFGLPVGTFCEILRHEVEAGRTPGIDRLEAATERSAWSWAAVHLRMQDAEAETSFLERLRELGPDVPDDLEAILAPGTPADRQAFEARLRDHVAALRPTTAVDWIAAGRAAEHLSDVARARDHYARALALVPGDPEACLCTARLAERHDPGEQAVRAWRAFLAVAPLEVEARESLAHALERLGELEGLEERGYLEEGARERKLAREIREALAAPAHR